MRHDIRNRNTQRGAVLAIGLILLAVATLVTLTAMNTGVMQESMTANQDNNARSFMAAEAGGAEVVSWINTQLKEHGKLTGAPALSGNVGSDSSITYEMELHEDSSSWTTLPLKVLIEGRALAADNATVLARTELLVEWQEPPPAGPNPPAAISCFNGPCSISAGAGKGADEGYGTVSGFNHPIPLLDCTGKGCRTKPTGDDMTTPAVPAVYLEESGSVGLQGGKHDAYQGLDPSDGESTIIGSGIDVAWTPETYKQHSETPPTWETIFPAVDYPDGPQTELESGRTPGEITGDETEVGTLVIDSDDVELDMKGTSLFVGVIVIQNCGSIKMAGNPNVYGAVIVNADGCGETYDPFGGGGTPAVRFVGGPGGGGSGVGTDKRGITIWNERSQ